MALFGGHGVKWDMTTVHTSDAEAKLLARGIRLELDDTAKAFIESKTERLFRHEPRILRVRIDVESDVRSRTPRFTAKGRIELAGPDLTASVTTDAARSSITLLIEKLDRMLRKRTSNLLRRRATGDIRAHAAPMMLA
jgi:putative sigma-54 modulation protein